MAQLTAELAEKSSLVDILTRQLDIRNDLIRSLQLRRTRDGLFRCVASPLLDVVLFYGANEGDGHCSPRSSHSTTPLSPRLSAGSSRDLGSAPVYAAALATPTAAPASEERVPEAMTSPRPHLRAIQSIASPTAERAVAPSTPVAVQTSVAAVAEAAGEIEHSAEQQQQQCAETSALVVDAKPLLLPEGGVLQAALYHSTSAAEDDIAAADGSVSPSLELLSGSESPVPLASIALPEPTPSPQQQQQQLQEQQLLQEQQQQEQQQQEQEQLHDTSAVLPFAATSAATEDAGAAQQIGAADILSFQRDLSEKMHDIVRTFTAESAQVSYEEPSGPAVEGAARHDELSSPSGLRTDAEDADLKEEMLRTEKRRNPLYRRRFDSSS